MADSQQDKNKYVSNPFVLTWRGLSRLFKVNQTQAIIILVLGLLGSFNNYSYQYPGPKSEKPPQSFSDIVPNFSAIVWILIVLAILLVIAVFWFIGTMINGYVNYVAYKTSRGEEVSISSALKAVFKKFWTIVLIQIIVGIKVVGGFLLLIVPGVRAALRYQLVYLLMFDEDLMARQAIKRSKWLTKDHLIEVFGMTTAAGIVPFIGQLLTVGGMSLMYPQLKRLKTAGAAKPAVHWLNYLGFILMALFFLFILGIIALIAAAYK